METPGVWASRLWWWEGRCFGSPWGRGCRASFVPDRGGAWYRAVDREFHAARPPSRCPRLTRGGQGAGCAWKIGRAPCRDRVCQYVLISGGAESFKQQTIVLQLAV